MDSSINSLLIGLQHQLLAELIMDSQKIMAVDLCFGRHTTSIENGNAIRTCRKMNDFSRPMGLGIEANSGIFINELLTSWATQPEKKRYSFRARLINGINRLVHCFIG